MKSFYCKFLRNALGEMSYFPTNLTWKTFSKNLFYEFIQKMRIRIEGYKYTFQYIFLSLQVSRRYNTSMLFIQYKEEKWADRQDILLGLFTTEFLSCRKIYFQSIVTFLWNSFPLFLFQDSELRF